MTVTIMHNIIAFTTITVAYMLQQTHSKNRNRPVCIYDLHIFKEQLEQL